MPLPRAVLLATTLFLPMPASAQQSPCGLFDAAELGDSFAVIAHRCGVSMETLSSENTGVDGTARHRVDPDRGEPVSPGPRILQTSESSVAVATEVPDTRDQPDDALLLALVGDWTRTGEVCADPLHHWLITPKSITVGGENGVNFGRDFIFSRSIR